MQFSTAAILSFLAATPIVNGLGINCRGSGACVGSSDSMRKLQAAMRNVPGNGVFGNEQQIICNANNICVYFTSIGNGNGSQGQAQLGLNDLVAHGCNICGSDPINPGNDVSKGALTVNFVQTASPVFGFV